MLKSMKAKLKSQSGFSLVELIVVIAIMVILIAMLLPSVTGLISKASSASSASAAASIYTAATTALTNNLAANKSGSAIASALASDSDPDLTILGNLGSKVPDGITVKVFYNESEKKILFVDYADGNDHWVNPTGAISGTDGTGFISSGSVAPATGTTYKTITITGGSTSAPQVS